MSWFHLFVDRPVLASVLSIVLVIAGIGSFLRLPVAEYPTIAPPTITVSAIYPGATAETAAQTVAAPLEEEINGVEGMVYMLSQSTGDGTVGITVTFEPGTDLDAANVLVQNRVARAEPSLPAPVRTFGVTVQKSNDDILTIINLISPDASRDLLYLSNYARTQIIDRLLRVDGVGQVNLFAERAYSMRIWLNPERLAARNLTAGEVVANLALNNTQVASGTLGGLPNGEPGAQQFGVETQGRLTTPEAFGRVVVSRSEGGRVTRITDVARVELGAETYAISGYLSDAPSIPIAIYASPDANALAVAEAVAAEIDTMSATFPAGVQHRIAYNPTEFISASVAAVYQTIIEAGVLVVLTILVFLQTWRAAIIPVLSIPVSLIGTFLFLAALGFSINTLTLFGLVLAIGIVVDDAIVVVENVQRYLRDGLSPREAARRTMDDVSGALIAIGLVLGAVFIPVAFVTGVTGIFFQQFALTVVSATTISVAVSLTLSAALSGSLMRPPAESGFGAALSNGFNAGFDRVANAYAALTRRLIRFSPVVFLVYAGLIGFAVLLFLRTPTGFIPDQDKGYFIAAVSLPPGATLPRTEAVVEDLKEVLLAHPAIAETVGFAGFNGATFTPATNGGAVFAILEPFEDRLANDHSVANIIAALWPQVGAIEEALVFLLQPPAVQGLGSAGGFELYLQDRQGRGVAAMEQQLSTLAAAANADPALEGVFSFFNTVSPRVFADIDRDKAEILGVGPGALNEALEINLGSAYVNDFTFIGRNYRVTAQADAPYRDELRDIASYRVRSDSGALVPLGSISEFRYTTGPDRLPRYNLYPSAELQGNAAPGVSSGQALTAMEAVAERTLADGFDIEWTGLAFQQQQAGAAGYILFGLSVLLVFLTLAALYESWILPFAVILIVPMCLLSAMIGVSLRGFDNNILTQVGLVVLLGLAAKNAILIVEFARKAEAAGATRIEAAVEAARLRLRPILMTSLAFIFGVIPLVIASGAGAELRQAIGTAVFGGMIGVTAFGLLFTPVFYVACRALAERLGSHTRAIGEDTM
ncbi:multidrug efflux RND transporter permease subunit [Aestuariivita sp.]|jgi:HAE1 family hydrophobic/amphiphilic exporter-1|uniref:efflux RND transporter permease subunit n=1 Tax=Aestuariivita sp. TaxID=1872407 RepID=UPI0021744B93|nr:multidrug efflux RND transporter permease subunit [Aestuariivita sp.]MCE8009042.1 multidrug efflux RND transporter permease subunit [Aestuariivita sp.]